MLSKTGRSLKASLNGEKNPWPTLRKLAFGPKPKTSSILVTGTTIDMSSGSSVEMSLKFPELWKGNQKGRLPIDISTEKISLNLDSTIDDALRRTNDFPLYEQDNKSLVGHEPCADAPVVKLMVTPTVKDLLKQIDWNTPTLLLLPLPMGGSIN